VEYSRINKKGKRMNEISLLIVSPDARLASKAFKVSATVDVCTTLSISYLP